MASLYLGSLLALFFAVVLCAISAQNNPLYCRDCTLNACLSVPKADGGCDACICDGLLMPDCVVDPNCTSTSSQGSCVEHPTLDGCIECDCSETAPQICPPIPACPSRCQVQLNSGCPRCTCPEDVTEKQCPIVECPANCEEITGLDGCPACACPPEDFICPEMPACPLGCIDELIAETSQTCLSCNCTILEELLLENQVLPVDEIEDILDDAREVEIIGHSVDPGLIVDVEQIDPTSSLKPDIDRDIYTDIPIDVTIIDVDADSTIQPFPDYTYSTLPDVQDSVTNPNTLPTPSGNPSNQPRLPQSGPGSQSQPRLPQTPPGTEKPQSRFPQSGPGSQSPQSQPRLPPTPPGTETPQSRLPQSGPGSQLPQSQPRIPPTPPGNRPPQSRVPQTGPGSQSPQSQPRLPQTPTGNRPPQSRVPQTGPGNQSPLPGLPSNNLNSNTGRPAMETANTNTRPNQQQSTRRPSINIPCGETSCPQGCTLCVQNNGCGRCLCGNNARICPAVPACSPSCIQSDPNGCFRCSCPTPTSALPGSLGNINPTFIPFIPSRSPNTPFIPIQSSGNIRNVPSTFSEISPLPGFSRIPNIPTIIPGLNPTRHTIIASGPGRHSGENVIFEFETGRNPNFERVPSRAPPMRHVQRHPQYEFEISPIRTEGSLRKSIGGAGVRNPGTVADSSVFGKPGPFSPSSGFLAIRNIPINRLGTSRFQ